MRKSLPSATLCLVALPLCLALAACKPAAQPPAAPAGDAPVASTPADAANGSNAGAGAAAAAADTSADGHGIDGDVIVSTNEPFWNATVSGQVLVLKGIEDQRDMAVSRSETVGATRTLLATDARGQVELEVTATECQDTMSGAMFPFSAVLAIDRGTPVRGCARPASMPPPGKGL